MARAVGKAHVEPEGNAIRVDPLMAAFTAIALMATNLASARPLPFTRPSLARHKGTANTR
jgi:hypothetical protein